jgi:histidyl-tRNA synthetase
MTTPVETALYYGFTPTSSSMPEKKDLDFAKSVSGRDERENGEPKILPEEIFSLLRIHFLKSIPALPLMIVHERRIDKRKEKNKNEYCLDIVGSQRSIADATIIKACYEIVHEEGYEDMVVELNSVGDKDSFARFSREFTSYFKKHGSELHPDCRALLKKNPYDVTVCAHEKCIPIKDRAPHPINYLSEPSRAHFKEILEILEMSEVPYTINNNLIENPEFALHTVFRILAHDKDKKELFEVCRGTRWGNLAKKMGLKKDVYGISAVVCLKNSTVKAQKKIKKPQFYFIQMGQEAKLHSLDLIERLRRAKVPIYHSLTKDKFAAQFGSAESARVPYILIMGQKESIERTVLVRDMSNRSQDTIRIDRVSEYLKKLI